MEYIITPTDLRNIKDIFKNHYDSIIARLPENEQLPTRIFIEEGLIFEEDKRPNSIGSSSPPKRQNCPVLALFKTEF